MWRRTISKIPKKYNYVIVGGGSAGCVLANRLTESGSKSVLLVEAGPSDLPPVIGGKSYRLDSMLRWQIHMPSALMYNLASTKYNWWYNTVPQENCKNREFYWPRGRVLGGSSSLNAMVYVRGHGDDQNRWAKEIGDSTWDYDHFLPYFKRAQTHQEGADHYRGCNGPLHVSYGDVTNSTPLYNAFIEAGVQAGYPRSNDLNGFQQEGFGRLDMTVNPNTSTRWSAASAYLRPARSRPNLSVVTGTLTDKVILEGTTAKGIQVSNYKKAGETEIIYGNEIILSSGAINSPQLLQLSGIGNAEHLKRVGIDPKIDLKGVGENLQDHLDVSVQQECKLPGTFRKKYFRPTGFEPVT